VAQAHDSLQLTMERLVLGSAPLQAAAKAALGATIGAYSTYPAEFKDIFHVKNLHLGHMAKSFALRDAPSTTGGKGKTKEKRKHGERPLKKGRSLQHTLRDEFSAGGEQPSKISKEK
jgi:ATP-dependent RNA helicase DDX31/DBP7